MHFLYMIIPKKLPSTQSWIYMLLILNPFDDCKFKFNDKLLKEIMTVEKINVNLFNICDAIKKYYVDNNINLSSSHNLSGLKLKSGKTIRFDSQNYSHIPGIQQEELFADIGILLEIEVWCQKIIIDHHGEQLTI